MLKKYDLVHLNGEMYMIDKKAEIAKTDWYYTEPTSNLSIRKCIDINYSFEHCSKILASTDKNLNLPLLPPIEEDIDKALERIFDCKKDLFQKKEWNWFKKVYKAASRKYTEEDMRRAFIAGGNMGAIYKSLQVDEDWDALKTFDEREEEELQFVINKKSSPTSVEVRMEKGLNPNFVTEGNDLWLPEVDENNIVKVVKWN